MSNLDKFIQSVMEISEDPNYKDLTARYRSDLPKAIKIIEVMREALKHYELQLKASSIESRGDDFPAGWYIEMDEIIESIKQARNLLETC